MERVLALRPGTPEMLLDYGIALAGVGRHAEALAALERVVALTPNNSRAWSNRGALLSRLHRNEEALTDVDRALALDPVNEDAWNNRGLILVELAGTRYTGGARPQYRSTRSRPRCSRCG